MTEEKIQDRMVFDFTPDPKVLIALTHTSMQPLDALCELIDNAIDSFSGAKLQGIEITSPVIWIDLPKKADIDKNIGILRIRDNGPGMTPQQAEKAIKAGYSANNSYDSLGLFGMGFNISTGKMGRVTTFITARPNENYYTKTVIDLEKINRNKSYQLEATKVEKSPNFDQGTIIEISNWWPDGNPNNGFVKKLIQYGLPRIREEIGRRYATILRNKQIRIVIDKTPCEPFEHCVWGSNRFVERGGNQIPARYDIDKVVGMQRHCGNCRTIISDGDLECPSCHSTTIRTIEERVKGWVGIQRFDSATEYGIDLIRNGRAIRIGEKNAFFEFVDEFKNVIKDYPIDGPYGRIVGEISLDFVPVDFLKQDFQRSSDEWQRAMRILRGESSLQPKQPGADHNDSYVYKLYQGYRKVRECGKADMYMGYWDPTENRPKRISRDVEKQFYEKFKAKEPGYYDDAEWWKKVEEATQQPIETLVECPICSSQNLKESEICTVCGKILIGKNCIDSGCGEFIPKSAIVCPKCGKSQVPQIEVSWRCAICGTQNRSNAIVCANCGNSKDTPNTLGEEFLLTHSNKDDTLSVDSMSIVLADGTESGKLKIETYITHNPIISLRRNSRFPLVVFKSFDSLKIFIDATHPMYTNCTISKEEMVANEIAAYIYDTNRNQSKYEEHNLSNIAWKILEKYWINRIELNINTVKESCSELLQLMKIRLADNVDLNDSEFLFSELSNQQQKEFMAILFENKIEISRIGELKKNGQFIRYVPDEFILQIYEAFPDKFFNGVIWKVDYNISNPDVNEEVLRYSYEQIYKEYKNSLEAVIIFLAHPIKEALELRKVAIAIEFLKKNIEE